MSIKELNDLSFNNRDSSGGVLGNLGFADSGQNPVQGPVKHEQVMMMIGSKKNLPPHKELSSGI